MHHSGGVGVAKTDEKGAEVFEFCDFVVTFRAPVRHAVDGTHGRRVDYKLVALRRSPLCAQHGGQRIARYAVEGKRCVVPQRIYPQLQMDPVGSQLRQRLWESKHHVAVGSERTARRSLDLEKLFFGLFVAEVPAFVAAFALFLPLGQFFLFRREAFGESRLGHEFEGVGFGARHLERVVPIIVGASQSQRVEM